MTFLEPWYLAGLGAVAIPLLIHLLTRPRLREDTFPLVFLLRSQGRSRLFPKLPTDRLLLGLRMALVAAGVILLARPACHKQGPGGGTSIAVVLDCSASMAAQGPQGTLLEAAKQKVLTLLDDVDSACEVTAVRAPQGEASPLLAARSPTLQAFVQDTQTGAAATSVWGLLETGLRAVSRGAHKARRVWVVSDLCGQAGSPSVSASDVAGVGVRFERVVGVAGNPYVRSVRWGGGLQVAGGTARVDVELDDLPPHPLEVVLSTGEKVSRRTTMQGGGRTQTVSWPLDIGGGSLKTAKLVLPQSPLAIDDTVYVACRARTGTQVLVVAEPDQAEGWLVQQALRPEGQASPWHVSSAGPSGLTRTQWESADVIVWIAPDRPPPWEPPRRILLFLGADAFSQADDRSTVPFRSRTEPVALGRVDYHHPVFARFAATARGRIDSPLFFFHHRLDVQASEVVAYFTDGWPAVVDSAFRVIVTSGLGADETDWATRGSFLPFLWEALAYLSEPTSTAMGVVGQPMHVGVERDSQCQVLGPRGNRWGLTSNTDSTLTFVPELPGFYRVIADGKWAEVVAANVDPAESDLGLVDLSGVYQRLRTFGAELGSGPAEWWVVALALVVILLAGETFLSAPR